MSTHDEYIESICETCGETITSRREQKRCLDCFSLEDHLGSTRYNHMLTIVRHQAELMMQEQFELLHANLEQIKKIRELNEQ